MGGAQSYEQLAEDGEAPKVERTVKICAQVEYVSRTPSGASNCRAVDMLGEKWQLTLPAEHPHYDRLHNTFLVRKKVVSFELAPRTLLPWRILDAGKESDCTHSGAALKMVLEIRQEYVLLDEYKELVFDGLIGQYGRGRFIARDYLVDGVVLPGRLHELTYRFAFPGFYNVIKIAPLLTPGEEADK
jgi:hypothetical protein